MTTTDGRKPAGINTGPTDTGDLRDLSHGQRNGLAVLLSDLGMRRDLSDHAKADLVADRVALYRERNAERQRAHRSGSRATRGDGVTAPTIGLTLQCIDCGHVFGVPSAKPRVPLCTTCKGKREVDKVARRKSRGVLDFEMPRRWTK